MAANNSLKRDRVDLLAVRQNDEIVTAPFVSHPASLSRDHSVEIPGPVLVQIWECIHCAMEMVRGGVFGDNQLVESWRNLIEAVPDIGVELDVGPFAAGARESVEETVLCRADEAAEVLEPGGKGFARMFGERSADVSDVLQLGQQIDAVRFLRHVAQQGGRREQGRSDILLQESGDVLRRGRRRWMGEDGDAVVVGCEEGEKETAGLS